MRLWDKITLALALIGDIIIGMIALIGVSIFGVDINSKDLWEDK